MPAHRIEVQANPLGENVRVERLGRVPEGADKGYPRGFRKRMVPGSFLVGLHRGWRQFPRSHR